ncbi:hypothetical protein [Glycomyces algeriensis]|uniref:SUKH-4 immunity protein of toxin-antitoxin system n=1 Tax=Glycomyces algeriensis TaxID=256037 RepID=A0A9W6G9T3_9ACTN|nr:hypothetical protein [Glycomyces algeriensis]MDA1369003.1 hypothetical protein [Glycomyces algeriensis]MDR7350152.1 hypothetical protein [Glycomyces algeriensis]GLI42864.1 hypothetical protein GALLR39Z86_27140 [Glycomyces algeriensis]
MDHPLGFALTDESGTRAAAGRTLRLIGHVHSPAEFLIGEDTADATVWVLDVARGELHPLNRDRERTERFLAAFGAYLHDGPPAPAPMVLDARQAAERLALLRAGKVAPRAPARPAVPHRKRLRRLLEALERADPDALAASWWCGSIEQAKDDLL